MRGFDNSGQWLLFADEKSVEIVGVESGATVANLRWEGDAGRSIEHGCLHSDGHSLLFNMSSCLSLIDVNRPQEQLKIFLGGIRDISKVFPFLSPDVSVEEAIASLRELWHAKQVALGNPHPDDIPEQVLKQWETAYRTMPRPPLAQHANLSTNCMTISGDGEWVICGTDKGLLVYRWQDLRDQLKATWHFASDREYKPGFPKSEITAIAEDTARGEVVFAGRDGLVRALDLRTGKLVIVLEPPEPLRIYRIALTLNGERLCLSGAPDGDDLSAYQQDRMIWQMWNYTTLREGASA